MRMLTFANRNVKEILRDPVNLGFGLGFPLVLLALLSAIQANVPVSLFEIEHLAPGIAIFGLSFITLFSATVIAKDRSSALLQRLYTTPLTALDFILGYTLPLIPMSVVQCAVCYIAAIILGLEITVNIVYAILFTVPICIFYISVGLLCGSVFNDKQVGGICGALFTNLSAWLSGTWFDLELVGGGFKKVAYMLPFVHAVETQRAVIAGNIGGIFPHIWWIVGYSVITFAAASIMFVRQMKKS